MSKPWRWLEVTWSDSTVSHRGWQTHAEALESRETQVLCVSLGFVLADDRRGISLASSVHMGEVAGVIHIPKGAVVRKRRLR